MTESRDNMRAKILEAKKASLEIAASSASARTAALVRLSEILLKRKKDILAANKKDCRAAQDAGLKESLVSRLSLTDAKFSAMIKEVTSVSQQDDPVGKVLSAMLLDKGLVLSKISVPLGVICAIFEARPDAMVQISALLIRTANAGILKAGKEAKNTVAVLFECIRDSLRPSQLPEDAIQLIETREAIQNLLQYGSMIDMIIHRGSSSLVRYIQENSRIPVLGHAEGICHEYVHKSADLRKAVLICKDAKCQYPAACNAMETLLVDSKIAGKFLPQMAKALDRKSVV